MLKMYRVTAVNHDDGDATEGAWVMANNRADACSLFIASVIADAREAGDADEGYTEDTYRDFWEVDAWQVPARVEERGVIDAYVVHD